MKKRIILTIMTVVMGTFLLMGCSNSSKDSISESSDKESVSADSEAESTSDDSAAESEENQVRIGFSQCQSSDPWRIAQTNDIKRAAAANGYYLIYTDAQGNTSKQISDVEDIVAQGVDYLILDAREYEASAACLDVAKKAGVEVILIDRLVKGTAGEDYITYIGTDFVWEGREAGKWLAEKLEGKGKIVEISGTAGSSAAIDRQSGFMEAINENPDMEVIASQTADFSRAEAQSTMENILQSQGDEISAVFAHNDEMGLGVIQAIKGAGLEPGKDIIVVSCDGQSDAVKAVIAGELGATVTCNPYYGDITFEVLGKIIKGEDIETNYILEDILIDATNAEERLPLAH